MNYIKHLTGFFNKSNQDQTISPTHISLYLALFQRWNLNRFKNPIIISREEMMTTAKIKSKGTYHKCMKELHERRYIIYKPSYNPYQGTEVILPDLSTIAAKMEDALTSSNFETSKSKNELLSSLTTPKFKRTPSKNDQQNEQVYIVNNKTLENNCKTIDTSKKKNVFSPPDLELVKQFFTEKNGSTREAEKYFNYYSSKGWLVGGKTKMKDWQAAARNWILNVEKFNPTSSGNNLNPKNLNVSNSKNYAEPL
ncbi:hypothetical protein SAMN05444143_104102 [Flavobacterium succinicans]|uniref:Uncharacterized protein n=1 Tax=Flavobacterium succinicans TaxID=29536 RepID=A0A1I4V2S2_9FLAO|nr:hypothetical protein [Flavobacterium succinicans]SFM95564.1 hypothetical protein SAMN05444143_104102 [Flavobacterium succinicans]